MNLLLSVASGFVSNSIRSNIKNTSIVKKLGLDHPLTIFAFRPHFIFSDMADTIYHDQAVHWYNLYWLSFGIILSLLTVKFWQRGSSNIAQKFTRLSKGLLTGTGIMFFASGSYVYYQTNIFKKDLDPIKSLNDQLCHIISMKKRIDKIDKLNEIKNTSSEEMTRQIEKMNVESTSYFEECGKHLKLVEFHEIKNCVAAFLEKEKIEMEKLNENYNCKIYRGQLYELAQQISLDVLLIGVLVGMIMILDKYSR